MLWLKNGRETGTATKYAVFRKPLSVILPTGAMIYGFPTPRGPSQGIMNSLSPIIKYASGFQTIFQKKYRTLTMIFMSVSQGPTLSVMGSG